MEQLAELPVPDRVQLVALKMPAPLLVKLMVPVGVIAVPGEVSVTVAEQIVCWLTTTEDGVHVTRVEVARLLTVRLIVLELPLWLASPP